MKRNTSKRRLEQLIESVTGEVCIAKKVTYEEAEEAVNQLIDIAGNAALALGVEDRTITIPAGKYEFTLTTKYLNRAEW